MVNSAAFFLELDQDLVVFFAFDRDFAIVRFDHGTVVESIGEE